MTPTWILQQEERERRIRLGLPEQDTIHTEVMVSANMERPQYSKMNINKKQKRGR